MAVTTKNLTYRGEIRGIVPLANKLVMTTVHPDGYATAISRIDPEKLELESIDLPCGGLCLATTTQWQPDEAMPTRNQTAWVGGDDGHLYRLASSAKKLETLKHPLATPANKLVSLDEKTLAALCGQQLVIVSAEDGSEIQSFDLGETATSLASDPTGHWIAAGNAKGTVAVFEREDKDAFQPSESEKLHEGAVTSLLFEPEELRFFSAGADQKLLLTHARGTLQPEDRGRGASHKDLVTAMVHVPSERFVSVSRDKTCKTWARSGGTRPATFDDAVPEVVDACVTLVHKRPHLVIAGADHSIRFILLDAGGRFSSMTHRLYDAYDRAADLLKENDVAQRGEAVHALAEYADARAVEMLSGHLSNESDPSLRRKATELIAGCGHPRVPKLLEPLLKHKDDKVREAAFEGLVGLADKEDLRPFDLATSAKKANIGIAAVEVLSKRAKSDDRALQMLVRAMDKDPDELRAAALLELENAFEKKSPEPTLIAGKAERRDTRRLALIRAFQRDLLGDARIAGMVRRAGDDQNAHVRRTAFLVALTSRKRLAKAVRERDETLHRQLFELENFELRPSKSSKSKQPPKIKATKIALDAEDYEPLLSAMASRHVDTCLLGARCLALIGDRRALGTLLQLSREDDGETRVQVCQALEALEDRRAAQRLETMIQDEAPAVRDAAYSAIETIYESEPLDAADLGLGCAHADVRRRALKTLTTTMRKAKSKADRERCDAMMLRALNDEDDSVCSEAFKSLLGMKSKTSTEDKLAFALQSIKPNVRREVLTEAMAADKQEWAQTMLRDLLNDASPKIRDDAYEHLLSKSKGRDIEVMRVALGGKHHDIRLRATESLIRLKTKVAQELLVTATSDNEKTVREKAVTALINLNNVDTLRQAMASQYTDVRLPAACARALYHDESATAPLLETALAPEPERDADKKAWERDAVIALNGLGMLGREDFVSQLLPLLANKHAGIRLGAASAVSRCARPSQIEMLKEHLQHHDNQVQSRIALALAYCREPLASPIVFSAKAAEVLSAKDLFSAAVVSGEQTEPRVIAALDGEPWIGNAALLTLLFRQWLSEDDGPTKILAALSASEPRVRLFAAEVLESFENADKFELQLVELFNDRGDGEKAWAVSKDTIRSVASLLVLGPPHIQTQAITLLEYLAEEKQEHWDFAWSVFQECYADEIKAAEKSAASITPKPAADPDELRQLAFGTYVGLVREQGGYHSRGKKAGFGMSVVAVRQAAIRRLVRMASDDESVSHAACAILTQALGDPLTEVRTLAFEQLSELGVEDEERAAAAVECGHKDLAINAMKLLSSGAGKKGQAVLEDIIATRDDAFSKEAAILLHDLAGVHGAAAAALESPFAGTRSLGVSWLAENYKQDAKCRKALVAAYKSRHKEVRRYVAIALATEKDKNAFEMLSDQLAEASSRRIQTQVIDAMVALGDSRSANVLLQALREDQEGQLQSGLVLAAIGSLRNADVTDELLELLDKDDWRDDIARALTKVSGYDQPIEDANDERTDRKWLEKQHPRNDEVLAKSLTRYHELNLPKFVQPLLWHARWSLGNDVNEVLGLLAVHPDETIRLQVVNAIGWRLHKRNGPAEPLRTALEHRDPNTKFAAAVGLAWGGHDDGMQVLMSGVELMTDLEQRKRGVEALGKLADERALDMLLKLASEDGHALQDTAAEAIGHLAKSDQAEEIFELLKRLLRAGGSVANRAFVGLRYFDTPSGWDLIREVVKKQLDDGEIYRWQVDELGHNDTPETRQLLLDALSTASGDIALLPARRVFGDESLEPDYAVLRAEYFSDDALVRDQQCLKRVCEQGEPKRIFDLLAESQLSEELAAALYARDPAPVAEAVSALESPHQEVVQVAASLIGRSGGKSDAKKLGSVLEHWIEKWEEKLREIVFEGGYYFYVLETTTDLLSSNLPASQASRESKPV
ncbi:MAG: HEAT repeat domain-containing protein, partial [Planctomycetota bacterium]